MTLRDPPSGRWLHHPPHRWRRPGTVHRPTAGARPGRRGHGHQSRRRRLRLPCALADAVVKIRRPGRRPEPGRVSDGGDSNLRGRAASRMQARRRRGRFPRAARACSSCSGSPRRGAFAEVVERAEHHHAAAPCRRRRRRCARSSIPPPKRTLGYGRYCQLAWDPFRGEDVHERLVAVESRVQLEHVGAGDAAGKEAMAPARMPRVNGQ